MRVGMLIMTEYLIEENGETDSGWAQNNIECQSEVI